MALRLASIVAMLLVLPAGSADAAEPLAVARLDGSAATLVELSADGQASLPRALPADLRTPLGSLWKLYVHAWLVETGQPDPGYQCSGQQVDEVYCCEPGQRIDREQALVRSCGLYYEPARLGIEARQWRTWWQARGAPPWLADLPRLQPATEVPVLELLHSFRSLPAQVELRRLLLDVVLQARQPGVAAGLGGTLRAKTWSWHRRGDRAARIGGFGGWLVDGTPVWASGPGSSQALLGRHGAGLGRLFQPRVAADAGECVDVDLFERYPLQAVEQGGRPVAPGRLQGSHVAIFANGQRLPIESRSGELLLVGTAPPRLVARLAREDYVARVLDREAAAEPVAAARALAVVIRSYLLQSAGRRGSCLAIADSSASQRVAPRPASTAARAVVAWSADLVLRGSPVGYHLEQPGPDRLAWRDAVAQAGTGASWERILSQAFPRASLGRWHQPQADCSPVTGAAEWLRAQLPRWRARLDAEPGHAETSDFEVCRLLSGRPFVDRARRRIHVRALLGLQDRLDLTHEYLHLAFGAHPSGYDEHYVEALARRLLLE